MKKCLWIDTGPFKLSESIIKRIRKYVGISDLEIEECAATPEEDLERFLEKNFDIIIFTAHRDDMLQEIYDRINGRGRLYVLDFCFVSENRSDWTIHPPCGIHYVKFDGLFMPIIKDEKVIGLS